MSIPQRAAARVEAQLAAMAVEGGPSDGGAAPPAEDEALPPPLRGTEGVQEFESLDDLWSSMEYGGPGAM